MEDGEAHCEMFSSGHFMAPALMNSQSYDYLYKTYPKPSPPKSLHRCSKGSPGSHAD